MPDAESFDAAEYGRHISAVYDSLADFAFHTDTDATVALLAELADDGPVLEFGIGTGRIALPLAQRGLAVSGIDGSPDMLEQLGRKTAGRHLPSRSETSPTPESTARSHWRCSWPTLSTRSPRKTRKSRPFATPRRTSAPAATSSLRHGFPT
jgi:Methyltransferase domain